MRCWQVWGINLGLLCYFKYTNFFYQILAPLWNGKFQPLDIFLPVGISFFTFQSLSYTIDVYRRELVPLNRLLDYTFYVSFFPQLVAGPIVRARDFIPQIRQPLFVSSEMFGTGVFFIISGLFKKAVISDYISVNFVERIFDNRLFIPIRKSHNKSVKHTHIHQTNSQPRNKEPDYQKYVPQNLH